MGLMSILPVERSIYAIFLFRAIFLLLLHFSLECLIRYSPVDIPNRTPDAGKTRLDPGHAKFHPAGRALYAVCPGLGLESSHATRIMAPDLAIGTGLPQALGS
jgi:hypothetical protein